MKASYYEAFEKEFSAILRAVPRSPFVFAKDDVLKIVLPQNGPARAIVVHLVIVVLRRITQDNRILG